MSFGDLLIELDAESGFGRQQNASLLPADRLLEDPRMEAAPALDAFEDQEIRQRGGEMEPVVGMLRRFLGADVTLAPADPNLVSLSPDERAARRAEKFSRSLAPPLDRWKVRPTVFAPTLPIGLNLERLNHVLVGIQGEGGACLGLGILEHEEDALRVLTSVGSGMTGLRLGSMRIDPETFHSVVISLREVMFGV